MPPVTAPPTQLPRLLAAAATRRRGEQRRRIRTSIAAGVAAILVAVLVGVGVHLVESSNPTPPSAVGYTAMQQTQTSIPVEAGIALTPAEAGTWVAMRCRYGGSYEGRSWPVWLVVFPRDGGQSESIGSWMATPGQEVTLTAITRHRPDQIARVELQGSNQRTLLWWQP
jgi:hypothetical protein